MAGDGQWDTTLGLLLAAADADGMNGRSVSGRRRQGAALMWA